MQTTVALLHPPVAVTFASQVGSSGLFPRFLSLGTSFNTGGVRSGLEFVIICISAQNALWSDATDGFFIPVLSILNPLTSTLSIQRSFLPI